MRKRFLMYLALFSLALLPAAVLAADAKAAKPTTPTIVIRVQAVDTLLDDAKYLAAFADRDELVKQFQGLLKSKTGPKGLEGIDTKRPLGLYGTIGAQGIDSTAVVMVPVTDEKAFLDLLSRLNLKAGDPKDGLYTVKLENLPFNAYLRFANQYVYVTARDESSLDPDALISPATLLPAGKIGAFSANLRIDQINDDLKQLALEQISLRLADIRDRQYAGDTSAQKEFWKAAFEDLGNQIKSVLRDGQELALRLDVDRQSGELSGEVTLRAKPGSKLATTIGDLSKTQSLFAGDLTNAAALQGLVSLSLPENLRAKLDPVIDESITKGLQKQTDPGKREVATRFVKALEPTLKSGTLDTAAVLRPAADGKHYTLLLGVRLKDGAGLDKAVRDLVKTLPEGDRERIKLDVDSAGSVKIHRIDGQKDYDAKAKAAFGDNPTYIAIRDDALFAVLGENGLATIKEALAAQPQTAAPIQGELALSALAPAIAIDRKDDKGVVAQAAQDAFKDKGSDRLRFTLEGGQALKIRFSMQAPVIKFGSQLDKAEKEK
jgi:hypothetical protein